MVENMSERMPSNIDQIHDAAIEFAYGRKNLPEDIEELYEWLIANKIYGGELHYELYYHLTDIEFSDEELRWARKLDQSAPIDDQMRVKYGREAIDNYVNGFNDHLVSPETLKLENDRGETIYICGIGYMAGQGGIEMTWHGFYESREKYLEYLKSDGGMRDSVEIDQIKDAEILELWKYH